MDIKVDLRMDRDGCIDRLGNWVSDSTLSWMDGLSGLYNIVSGLLSGNTVSCKCIFLLFVFCMFRYYSAVEAKKERTSKHAQSFGTKKVSQSTTPNQVCDISSSIKSCTHV